MARKLLARDVNVGTVTAETGLSRGTIYPVKAAKWSKIRRGHEVGDCLNDRHDPEVAYATSDGRVDRPIITEAPYTFTCVPTSTSLSVGTWQ